MESSAIVIVPVAWVPAELLVSVTFKSPDVKSAPVMSLLFAGLIVHPYVPDKFVPSRVIVVDLLLDDVSSNE